MAGLENYLERLLCTSAARAAVCSSVRRERLVFPLTVITPQGPGILVCVVRYRIELGECGSPEQCVIATAEWDYVED